MKKYIFGLLLLFTAFMSAQVVQDTILVRGNCEMCQSTIQNAVAKEPTARGTWNIQTKVLTLT